MSVKYTIEIFNESVLASICRCIVTREIKSNIVENTMELIMQINAHIDILKSKNLYSKNPNSGSISNTTYNLFQTLKNIFAILKKKLIISTILNSG